MAALGRPPFFSFCIGFDYKACAELHLLVVNSSRWAVVLFPVLVNFSSQCWVCRTELFESAGPASPLLMQETEELYIFHHVNVTRAKETGVLCAHDFGFSWVCVCVLFLLFNGQEDIV